MTERDRKAERDASRRLRRADTAASMLRMLYVMGALPAASTGERSSWARRAGMSSLPRWSARSS